tara:strand:- start:150 stop:587 length:438 start_codon:yes stop_codon:yes gene_type:complete
MNSSLPQCVDFSPTYTGVTYTGVTYTGVTYPTFTLPEFTLPEVTDVFEFVNKFVYNFKPTPYIKFVLFCFIIIHTFIFAYTIGVYYTYKKIFNECDENRKHLKRRRVTITVEESEDEDEDEDEDIEEQVVSRRETLRSYKRQKID